MTEIFKSNCRLTELDFNFCTFAYFGFFYFNQKYIFKSIVIVKKIKTFELQNLGD